MDKAIVSGFTMRRGMMGGSDPITFTFHDYIQCDAVVSSSYIDTELIPNSSTQWTFEGSFARSASIPSDYSMRGIFTRIIGGSYSSNYYLGYRARNQAHIVFNYNSRSNCESYAGVASTSINIGEWHTFRLSSSSGVNYGGECAIDGGTPVVYNNGSRPNSDTTTHLYLLRGYPCRLGQFKVYYQGNLVADMRPATRDKDGAVGMYDVVRGRFFMPTGSSTFVCGDGKENF